MNKTKHDMHLDERMRAELTCREARGEGRGRADRMEQQADAGKNKLVHRERIKPEWKHDMCLDGFRGP